MIGIYYFSGTGNTKMVAEKLHSYFPQSDCVRLKDGTEKVQKEYKMLIFCYPIHGFNAPCNVEKFAQSLPQGKTKFYIVKTSGEPLHFNDASSWKIVRILRQKGYVFCGESHYIMPYNMIFRHTDEMASKMWAAVQEKMPFTVQKIKEGKEEEYRPLWRGYVAASLCRIEHIGMHWNGRLYKVNNDKCIHCGKCVQNCPTKNISYKDGRFTFGKNCMGCASCFFFCPTDAFHIGLLNGMKVNGKYDFEKDPEKAEIGAFCHNAYVRYFSE